MSAGDLGSDELSFTLPLDWAFIIPVAMLRSSAFSLGSWRPRLMPKIMISVVGTWERWFLTLVGSSATEVLMLAFYRRCGFDERRYKWHKTGWVAKCGTEKNMLTFLRLENFW